MCEQAAGPWLWFLLTDDLEYFSSSWCFIFPCSYQNCLAKFYQLQSSKNSCNFDWDCIESVGQLERTDICTVLIFRFLNMVYVYLGLYFLLMGSAWRPSLPFVRFIPKNSMLLLWWGFFPLNVISCFMLGVICRDTLDILYMLTIAHPG